MEDISKDLIDFIEKGWKLSTKTSAKTDNERIILPFPYNTPCSAGLFIDFFYWDTYFLNVGLIASNNIERAKQNTENMVYLCKTLGYVPNSNNKAMINRSQPPYMTLAVNDVYETTKDLSWLSNCFDALLIEHNYWQKNRMTSTGLNKYGNSATEKELTEFWAFVVERMGLNKDKNQDAVKMGSHYLSEGESGWDFTTRFDNRGDDFCPVDLNCLMYLNEKLIEKFAILLNKKDLAEKYKKLSQNRKELIDKFLFDGEKYLDYDYVNNKFSKVVSCASLMPYFSKISSNKESALKVLKKLEFEYGIASAEKHETDVVYQWNYPNMWPPLVYLSIIALKNIGLDKEAERIAIKYKECVEREFKKSNCIWEKYDVTTGFYSLHNEYEITSMLGWSAGIYEYIVLDLLAKRLK